MAAKVRSLDAAQVAQVAASIGRTVAVNRLPPSSWPWQPNPVAHARHRGEIAHDDGKLVRVAAAAQIGEHAFGGIGGILGPALTEIGTRRSAAFLRNTLLNPDSTLPEGFAMVRAQTKDGQRLTGVRLNEDIWSIQLRDLAGGLRSFWKEDLKDLHKDSTKSPMPSFRGVFNESELTDVIAYLVSLRGGL